MARSFAAETAADFGLAQPELAAETVDALQTYQWPGNVRELRHVIRQAVLLGQADVVRPDDLELAGSPPGEGGAGPATGGEGNPGETLRLKDVEANLVRRALQRTGGNVSQAARLLGISQTALRYRLEKYNIAPGPGDEVQGPDPSG